MGVAIILAVMAGMVVGAIGGVYAAQRTARHCTICDAKLPTRCPPATGCNATLRPTAADGALRLTVLHGDPAPETSSGRSKDLPA